MADDVEVKLTATTDQLRASMKDAAGTVGRALGEMSDALKGFNTSMRAGAKEGQTFGQDVTRAFGQAAGNVLIATAGIGRAMLALVPIAGAAAAGIATALMGVGVFAMLRLQSEVVKLENVMGMMSDQATQTAVALRLIGSSADQYNNVALKLAGAIKKDEQGLQELGVVTRDAHGALLPLQTIMQNAFGTMQEFKSGADQAEFALKAFGVGAREVYELMDNLPAAQARAVELMRELGIEMGPQRQKEIEAYKLEMGALRVTVDTIAEQIGIAMLPGLKSLAAYFVSEGPSAVAFFVNAIKVLLSAFSTMGAVFTVVREYISAGFDNIGTEAKAVGDVVVAVFTFNWGQIPGIVDKAYTKVEERSKLANKRITDALAGLGDTLGALWTDKATPAAPGRGPLPSGNRTMPMKAKGGGGEASVMSNLENELKARENAFNRMRLDQGSFETWSIEQTRNYWAELLTSELLSTKDRLAVENKYYDAERAVQQKAFNAKIAAMETDRAAMKHNLEEQVRIVEREYEMIAQRYGTESQQAETAARRLVDIRQRLADQRIKIAEIESQMEAARGEHVIAMEQLALGQAVALRQVSAEQSFAIASQLEDRIYQMQRAAIERRKVLAGDDVVAQAQLDAQLEALEQSHQAKLTQISNAAELERKQFALAAQEALQTDVGNLINDLISGVKSLKDAFKDFAKSLTADLNRIASQQIAKMLFGAGTGGGDMFGSLLGGIFGGGGGGGGGLFGSLFGGFEGLGGYAVGTPYVPQDSLAMVHKGEAIIPAKYNNGGLGGGFVNTNQFAISGPMDTRTQQQIQRAAAEGVRRASLKS